MYWYLVFNWLKSRNPPKGNKVRGPAIKFVAYEKDSYYSMANRNCEKLLSFHFLKKNTFGLSWGFVKTSFGSAKFCVLRFVVLAKNDSMIQ